MNTGICNVITCVEEQLNCSTEKIYLKNKLSVNNHIKSMTSSLKLTL